MDYKDIEPEIKKLQRLDKEISRTIGKYIENVKIFHKLIKKEITKQVKKSIPKAIKVTSEIWDDPECPQSKTIAFVVTIDGEPEHIRFDKDDKYYDAIHKNEFIEKINRSIYLTHFRFVGNKKVKRK